MKNIIFLISILALFITSCEDVVNLDLPDGEVQLVVDGSITNQPGEKRVRLTTSSNYFDNKETPKVTGALVLLYDQTGVVDTLTEKEAGIYTTNYIGKVGSTYHIYIRTKEGEEYESQPEILQSVPEIDSIYYEYKEKTAFEDEGYYVMINTSEPGWRRKLLSLETICEYYLSGRAFRFDVCHRPVCRWQSHCGLSSFCRSAASRRSL